MYNKLSPTLRGRTLRTDITIGIAILIFCILVSSVSIQWLSSYKNDAHETKYSEESREQRIDIAIELIFLSFILIKTH